MTVHKTPYDNRDALCEQLHTARLDARLDVDTIARSIGVSYRVLSEWEAGIMRPSMRNFLRWARYFDLAPVITSPTRIYTTSEPCPNNTSGWELAEIERLGADLHYLRHDRGVESGTAADDVRITRTNLYKLEHGYGNLKLITLCHLAAYHSCQVSLLSYLPTGQP